ncbi:MAG: 3-oxoacyl-ACP reductase FabG [Halobacteriales archaeon]|nr:3-oxoacyl-ACP reductase FabG [Halobacteriales archaeon]
MVERQVCVVTGASRGIGRGIALNLGRHGASVVVNYNQSEEEAKDVVEQINGSEGNAMAVQGDVRKLNEMKEMRDKVRDEHGGADVLVNNAGITVDKKFVNMTREDWDRVMDVNLGGMFNATKAFFNDISVSTNGRLINISSVVGRRGNYGQANYATTKSGMFGFTRTLALELAASNSTANCVTMGFTRTDMLRKVDEEVQEKIRNRIPLERFAEVEDMTGIVRYLASRESGYMTGQIIGVDGGLRG